MNGPRLLLLTYEFAPFRGGIAAEVEGLAAGAASLGHDVHVLAPDYHRDLRALDTMRPYTVHRFTGDFCSLLSIDKLTRFARLCRGATVRLQPRVLHATDPQAQMALTALARFGLARGYCFTVHGTELLRYQREMLPRLWMRGAMRRPLAIACVSHAVRERLLHDTNAPAARAFVSHPGIAPRWFQTPADRVAAREVWGAGDDGFVIITVARRVPDKGHRLVIAALSRLPDALRARTRYVVVGTGPADYAAALAAEASRADVRLQLAGELDDDALVQSLDAADLFVMTSQRTGRRLEGFGLAYIEAAARGLPAIALDTGGAAEAVQDAVTGLVLPEQGSAETLAHAIERMLVDDEARARMGAAARVRARSLTWQAHAGDVYTRFLAATA